MLRVGKNKDIILGTSNRDVMIKEFKDFLHVLKKSGINITIFTWEPASAFQTGFNKIRGDALGRYCDTDILKAQPNIFGREYTEEELWANMKYFLNAIIPTAEKLGMILALHPNDPPSEEVFRGIPNLIRARSSYERVFKLANDSPSIKMEFCCGCWLEGATPMGNLLSCLRDYIKRDKIVIVHLRNVTAPLPNFTETFLDEGYGDIFEIVRSIVEKGYKGTIILDHTPELTGGLGLETAFCAGYIKAMIRASQAVSSKTKRT
jgi:mannonate dehydratase